MSARPTNSVLTNSLHSYFSSRCANIFFTKNPEKYHKYRPEEVEEMIEKLFDTSAWAGRSPNTSAPSLGLMNVLYKDVNIMFQTNTRNSESAHHRAVHDINTAEH